MHSRWHEHGRFCTISLLVLFAGCQAFTSEKPVAILVRDAETKAPLAAIDIRVTYPVAPPPRPPHLSGGVTAADGIAQLPVVPCGAHNIAIQATDPGYLPQDAVMSAAFLDSLETVHWWKAVDRHANFIIDMYARPSFAVELIVPNGYRGLITTETRIDEQAVVNGQRLFCYDVPPSGVVTVHGPPVLRRVFPPDFRARYADGTLLDDEMTIDKVGFHWLKQHGDGAVFVVGTQPEYDKFCRELKFDETATKTPIDTGEQRNRRGGRRRGGSPDSGP